MSMPNSSRDHTMSGKHPKARWLWRHKLNKGDDAELLKWVDQTGLERVARSIGLLTDASGERGQPEKPDSLLLLKIACLKRQRPDRKLHAIAEEVAREAHPHRKPHISPESLVSKLERDFRRQRHTWLKRAETISPPSLEGIFQDAGRPQSSNERRVLAKIIGLLPTAIDLYDVLRAEAKKLGPDEERLVRFVGRERAEPLLAEALKKQQTGSSFVTDSHGVRKIPRNFYDLVEAELQRFSVNRERPADGSRAVGRK
jgi:hypothetical protein